MTEKLLNGIDGMSGMNGMSNGVADGLKDAINNNSVKIQQEKDKCVTMKKRMGLLSGVALIVGTMIGNLYLLHNELHWLICCLLIFL